MAGTNMTLTFEPIGVIHSCYKEKFGIPRQPNLVDAPATLTFYPDFAHPDTVRGLEGFSHIWVMFVFHQLKINKDQKGWSSLVRPPRLGGNKKVGVFSSRSPFRPNPVGMSAVRLNRIEITDNGPLLQLSGVDMLDQTPVLDIKPYLPYSDAIPAARDGFAPAPPEKKISVRFSDRAESQIREKEKNIPHLETIITKILQNDPRPAYQAAATTHEKGARVFGTRIFDFDLKWQIKNNQALVLSLDS